ncbi:DUF5994 family protein [Streptacidiphilus jiangxiensis]|uniref:DUF5994 family protein n=1 Tax=Streptacidiphilus jiangxiensis TaxID=235985 RepID=UPI000693A19A|nr:DUF5994 family protein [Streptacidiphilus jiangxiensis]
MGADALGAPLLPRLLLEPTLSRSGMFDGAWWPRSNRVRVELPDLITALAAHVGRILRVGLDIGAWDEVPRTVMANGLVVRINWFAGCDGTVSITRGFQDHFLLLVVPPGTDDRTASAAMAQASVTENHRPAAELLGRRPAPTAGQPR